MRSAYLRRRARLAADLRVHRWPVLVVVGGVRASCGLSADRWLAHDIRGHGKVLARGEGHLHRWESFRAALDDVDAGRLTETVLGLLRDGLGVGLRMIVTGDRSVLLGRVASLVEDTLVLRLPDRTDAALAGLQLRDLPERQGAGVPC